MRIDRSNKRIRGAMAALILFLLFDSGCSAKDNETVQLIVKFNESATETQRNNLHNQIGAQKLRTIFGDTNAEVVRVNTKDIAAVVKAYEQSGIVKYAEKDSKVSIPPNEK